MIRVTVFLLALTFIFAVVLSKPLEDDPPLLPGALPAHSSSKYLLFKEISKNRIISGSPASRGQFPWQAGLYLTVSGGTSFCGGSLITNTWVLTAAHCVQGVSAVTAYLGVVNLQDSAVTTAQARAAATHPNYSSSTLANDIALLQLSTTVATGTYITTIALASATLGTGVSVTVSGWGRTSDSSSSISQTLNYVGLVTISNTDCQNTYGNIIQSGIVCTRGGTSTSQSTCNGDSGGPLITGSGSSATQVGIVSFGSSAGCSLGAPAGFTRVASYRTWINSYAGV